MLFIILPFGLYSQSGKTNFDKYHNYSEQNNALTQLNKKLPKNTKIHKLATTPGKKQVLLFEIGAEIGAKKKKNPAVFLVANLEGQLPISISAAIYLINDIIGDAKYYSDLSWYIIPNANPDASQNYFSKLKYADSRNGLKHNDDMDDQTDEDPFDDLNGDGLITQMRVKDILGEWLPDEKDPRMMRKADKSKGEKGLYKLYSEGLDNDKDGKYNEDPVGGTNIGINFPHLHKPFTQTGGIWPGSADESYAIMKFINEHPEIAMTMTYGSTNFCLIPPKGGRKGSVDLSRIKLDKGQARMLGAEEKKFYSLEQIVEMAQQLYPGVTEEQVASFMGLGAMVNPLSKDLKFYKSLSEDYKKYLKSKKMDTKRLDPQKAKDGSFELWSYYHLGVPTFSMDFWTLPKPSEEKKSNGLSLDKLEKMSKKDFLKLNNTKVDSFLQENKAPKQFSAERVKKMVKEGKMTPEKMVEMFKKGQKSKNGKKDNEKLKALLAYSDSELGGKGFVDWKPYNHPDFGEVEIGGEVPFTNNTPPTAILDSLLNSQIPWIYKLTDKLPDLKIVKTMVKNQGGHVYKLEAWVENKGFLPFPTAMGKKNGHVQVAVLELTGKVEVLSGKKRTPIRSLEGKSIVKYSWLVQSDTNQDIQISLSSANAGGDSKQIKLGGK
ncbi:MAG: M14 family metallopeptidase [Bacteroidota bacterium]